MSRIYEIVHAVELRHTPFAVSRLIMMSGVKVRRYQADSVDDPVDFVKVRRAVRELLKPAELDELASLLRDL